MTTGANSSKGFFITGNDTAVGKTYVSCQIIRQLKSRVASLKVRKPVESGCGLSESGYIAADGEALFRSNDCRENMDLITPLRFAAALAPDQAARREQQSLTLAQLENAVWNNIEDEDFILVEGAGGFYSPIAEDGLNADLAARLGLAVIVIIEDRLGAINQALLTIRAIEACHLEIRAIILNQQHPQKSADCNNLEALSRRVSYPVKLCPFQTCADDFQLLG